ncbi:MAG: hypothetical protein KA175_05030 [Flavobacteriales bacterium]|nr:hypothetical protein [Flavobacteriales bacterium]MBP6696960.1 hypothetical protein [Flavobacteriales bacterium]
MERLLERRTHFRSKGLRSTDVAKVMQAKARFLCLLIARLLVEAVDAQVHQGIYNTSLLDTTLAIVYLGVENDIVILGVEPSDALELVHTSRGSISASEHAPGHFRLVPEGISTGRDRILALGEVANDTLRVLVHDQVVLERVFTMHRIPNPEIRFGGLKDTIARAEEILLDPRVRVVLPNCQWEHSEAYVMAHKLTFQVNERKTCRGLRAQSEKDLRSHTKRLDKGIFEVSFEQAVDSQLQEHPEKPGEFILNTERHWEDEVSGPELPLYCQRMLPLLKRNDRLIIEHVRFQIWDGCPNGLGPYALTLR